MASVTAEICSKKQLLSVQAKMRQIDAEARRAMQQKIRTDMRWKAGLRIWNRGQWDCGDGCDGMGSIIKTAISLRFQRSSSPTQIRWRTPLYVCIRAMTLQSGEKRMRKQVMTNAAISTKDNMMTTWWWWRRLNIYSWLEAKALTSCLIRSQSLFYLPITECPQRHLPFPKTLSTFCASLGQTDV